MLGSRLLWLFVRSGLRPSSRRAQILYPATMLFVERGAQISLLKSRPTLLRGGVASQVAFLASNVISAPVHWP